jgi:hypothetical protein
MFDVTRLFYRISFRNQISRNQTANSGKVLDGFRGVLSAQHLGVGD